VKGVARLFGSLLFARVASAGLQALTLVMLARMLTPESFALVSGFLGVLLFISVLSDAGVIPAATRETAAGHAALVHELQSFNRKLGAISGVVFACALAIWTGVAGGVAFVSFAPFALWLGIERLVEFRFAVLLGQADSVGSVLSMVIRRIGPVLALGIAQYFSVADPVLFLGAGYAAGSLAALALVKRGVPAFVEGRDRDADVGNTAAARAFPFWMNSLAAQSRQLDVLCVAVTGGVAAGINYAPASRLISPLRMIPTTLAQATFPVAARHGRKGEIDAELLRSLVLAGLLPSAVFYGVAALLAEPIIVLLFGDPYIGSVGVLRIMLLGLVVASVSSLLTSLLQAAHLETRVARANCMNAVVTLGLIAFGAWWRGAAGAAAGLSLGYLLQAVSLTLVARERKDVKVPAGRSET
jgi:O-antigen/teichoic acid export membrane protein